MKNIVLGIIYLSFIIMIDTQAQTNLNYDFPYNDENVYCFDLNDNTLIYSNGKNITFYDLIGKTVIKNIALTIGSKVLTIKNDVNCDLIFIGTEAGILYAIEKSTGLIRFQYDYSSSSVTVIEINSNATILFVGLSNGMVYRYNIQNLNDHSEFYQHDATITSLKISSENHILAISSADGTVSLHNDISLEYINTLKVDKGWVRDIAFNNEKGIFVCVGDDGKLHQWNIKNIDNIHKLNTSKESGNWLLNVDVYKDGNAYCFGGVNGSLTIKHRFGILYKKFKGPVIESRFWDNGNKTMKILICVLGRGITYVPAKEMKFKSL